jgi:glucose/arabinose dehydrogenase
MRTWLIPGLALLVCVSLGLSVVEPQPPATPAKPARPARFVYPNDPDLPPGFSDTEIVTGLTGAAAMAVAPDGRVFVCEQTGALRVVKDDRLLPEPFLTVEVDSYWERGLIGVTLDPDFPRTPYVYVCYVVPEPKPRPKK